MSLPDCSCVCGLLIFRVTRTHYLYADQDQSSVVNLSGVGQFYFLHVQASVASSG
jgi:hypothetical protein